MLRRSACLSCVFAMLLLYAGAQAQLSDILPATDDLLDAPPPDDTLAQDTAPPPAGPSGSRSHSPRSGHAAPPRGPLEETAVGAPPSPSAEATAVTPHVLYGPQPALGAGAGGAACSNCDAPVYDYCVNNLKATCDLDKNYDCFPCFLWTVTQRCDGHADPHCTPSLSKEFGLPISAGQFSVDEVKGAVIEFLVMPGTNVMPTPNRGTEDYMKVGDTIWSYAWDVAVLGHLPATKFDEHTAGLAIVGPSRRQQHQMHIHIAKINPAVRMALVTSAWGKTPFSNFITIPNPVGPGHPMRVKFVQSGATEPLGSTAHPFASILDPSPPKGYVSLAKLDGHTAATQWPEFGIMVCRQSSTDPRNGFFIVGTYEYPGANLLCTNGLKC